MKTKNTRVRIKDIKSGAIIYTAHPFFGIRKTVVKSRPYQYMDIGLFYDCVSHYDGGSFASKASISDDGIGHGDSYNDRKSFFKEKQAIDYMNKMKTDKRVIDRHNKHLDLCASFDDCMDYED